MSKVSGKLKARSGAVADEIRKLAKRAGIEHFRQKDGKIRLFNKQFNQFDKGRGGRKPGLEA